MELRKATMRKPTRIDKTTTILQVNDTRTRPHIVLDLVGYAVLTQERGQLVSRPSCWLSSKTMRTGSQSRL